MENNIKPKGFIDLTICGERILINTALIVEVWEQKKKTRFKSIVELRTHITLLNDMEYIVAYTYDEIMQMIAEANQ